MPIKRTEPSRSAVDQAAGFKYTPAASTDLAKKFKAIRAAQAKAAKAAAAPHSHALLLPFHREAAQ